MLPYIFIYPKITPPFFRFLVSATLLITLVQGFMSPSNVSNILNVNGHINANLTPNPQKISHDLFFNGTNAT